MTREILVERWAEGYGAALVDAGELVDFVAAGSEGRSEPGAVHLARVAQSHAALGLIFLQLADGVAATMEQGKQPPAQGELVLVQVTAPARGDKPARATSRVALTGHLVILRPGRRSIHFASEVRATLGTPAMEAALASRLPQGFGLIVRGAAARAPDEAVAVEIDRLVERWRAIETRKATALAAAVPVLLFVDLASRRAALPLLRAGPDCLRVSERKLVRDFAALGVAATLEDGVKLFDGFGIAEALATRDMPVVALRDGGQIAVETTRAMTVIDIDAAGTDPELVNARAVPELARQLRLRDVIGTVMIDFLRENSQRQRRLERALADATAIDRRRVELLGWTRGGVFELRRGDATVD